ncbi:hypothetical protein CDIK_1970 [Cucumispora dikerogammari]|nr:hypothetical protein CDIK_1970 [Cucumispora dikerogammari]
MKTDLNSNKDLEFRNVCGWLQSGIPRTTNSVEGYHRHLNSLVGAKQDSLRAIGATLVKEQALVENYLLVSLYSAVSTKVSFHDSKIKELFKKRKDLSNLEYLKSIAFIYNISFN